MADPIPADEQSNYEAFRECLSEPVLRALAAPVDKPKPKRKRHAKKESKGTIDRAEERDKKPVEGDGTTNIKDIGTVPDTETQATDAEDLGEFIHVRYLPIPSSSQPDPLPANTPPKVPQQPHLPEPAPTAPLAIPLHFQRDTTAPRNLLAAAIRSHIHCTFAPRPAKRHRQSGSVCAAARGVGHDGSAEPAASGVVCVCGECHCGAAFVELNAYKRV